VWVGYGLEIGGGEMVGEIFSEGGGEDAVWAVDAIALVWGQEREFMRRGKGLLGCCRGRRRIGSLWRET
jgi:hypothetical protein